MCKSNPLQEKLNREARESSYVDFDREVTREILSQNAMILKTLLNRSVVVSQTSDFEAFKTIREGLKDK